MPGAVLQQPHRQNTQQGQRWGDAKTQELPSKKRAVRAARKQTAAKDPPPQIHVPRIHGRHLKGPLAAHQHLKTHRLVHAACPEGGLRWAVLVPRYERCVATAATDQEAGTTPKMPRDDCLARKSAAPTPNEPLTAQLERSASSAQETLTSALTAPSRQLLPVHEQKQLPLPQQPPHASVPETETQQPRPPSLPHQRQPASWKHGQPRHDDSAPTPPWTARLHQQARD